MGYSVAYTLLRGFTSAYGALGVDTGVYDRRTRAFENIKFPESLNRVNIPSNLHGINPEGSYAEGGLSNEAAARTMTLSAVLLLLVGTPRKRTKCTRV
jgi:hypothetical protein